MKKNSVLLAFLLLLFAGNLFAETGLLVGSVMSQSGAVLSNARITFTDADQNVVVQGVTGPTGRFSLNVPVGEFELRVNGGGFGKLKQMVRVVPGVLYLSFTVVQLPDTVDLRSDALQSNANLDAIVLDEAFLRTLSDNDSEFATSLAGTRVFGSGMTQRTNLLSNGGGSLGGAIVVSGGVGVGGFGGGAPGGGAVPGGLGGGFGGAPLGSATAFIGSSVLSPTSFIGQPRLSGPQVNLTGPEFIVDGLSGRLPPKDQVSEVWINSDPFTTEYSRPGFGRIHVTTLAPRAFHGLAAFNFHDESLDSPVSGFFGTLRSPYQVRYFHGELGGPLIPEKLFASLAVQRLDEDGGKTSVAAVTPNGPVNLAVDNGSADQIFNGRSQYQISERHQLNVNGRYRSEIVPNLGVGGLNLPEQGSTITNRGWDMHIVEVSRLGTNAMHETRVQVRRDTSDSAPQKEGTTIRVFGAFTGGGTSNQSASRDTQVQVENLLAWSTPLWTLRMGLQGYHIERNSHYRGATLGEFTFSSLNNYLAGSPSQYTQSVVNGSQDVRQTEASIFAQAEWYASPRFSLSGGLRYEGQTNLHDRNNLDPRIAFAYRAAPQIVLRGGLGIFHQRLTVDDVGLLERSNGGLTPSYLLTSNPSYPNPNLDVAATVSSRDSFALRDPHLAAPYLEVGSLSVEKWFDSGFLLSATADVVRGMRQYRIRNIDAPFLRDVDPATLTVEEVNQRRPFYPLVGFVNQFESVGFLESKNLSLRGRTPELLLGRFGVRFNGDYTVSWSEDDDGIPVDNYDRRAEWGRMSQTPRHNFWSGAMLRAPLGISLAALAYAHSGYPYSTMVFADTNRDDNYNERPAGARKNGNDGPNVFNLDLKLSKTLALPRVEATLFAYGQNVFNSRNYTAFSSSSSFGSSVSLSNPSTRRLELGVRLRF